ncbi:SMP-30/gluconolactonase/LRE family protein [Stigmatella hybrida]|uniref:SMP-30/gluconolactonase/LRE family protein n=1 Tax=Stigmatella hybrida TaxID=394097 RepID=UPI001CDA9CD3|nr:SMP-30/gluconolactonase/LRE family protein [Stigmatella hybrida]
MKLRHAAVLSVLVMGCAARQAPREGSSEASPPVTQVLAFEAALGQFPEGIAARGGEAYVGMAPTGQVLKVSSSGAVAPYGRWPAIPKDGGYLTGLAFDARGALYAGLVSFSPPLRTGIYRLPAGAEEATLFASHPELAFPNGLDFDAQGRLFVTDSSTGTVFAFGPEGQGGPWVTDASLQGNPTYCGPAVLPFPMGANGVAVDGDSVVAVSSDQASIVRIPIQKDGSAGVPQRVVGPDCAAFYGGDGLVRDPKDGSLWVAMNRTNRVLRITPDQRLLAVEAEGVFDGPASLAIVEEDGRRWMYVTNFGFITASRGGTPRLGLLKFPLPGPK